MYSGTEYLRRNPNWHVEDSPWKAKQILRMLARNKIEPTTVCEVGCGAGEILRQMQLRMDGRCSFWGYEISPDAFQLCASRANERLHFRLADIRAEKDAFFDLILLIDVVEHLEDYFGLLRDLRSKSEYKIFHIPLDISVQNVLRRRPFSRLRRNVGHLHFFTKEIALEVLNDVGYQVVDHFFTAGSAEYPESFKGHLMKIPRKLLFAVAQDLTARTLGGFSLLVLAK